jgi:sec-independent protein translocase protein TatA
MPGAPELLIVLVIVLILVGGSRLPKLARSVGQSKKEFQAGAKGEQPLEGPCPFCGAHVGPEARFCASCGKPADEIVAKRAEDSTR